MRELDLLDAISGVIDAPADGWVVGPGDDAAVLKLHGDAVISVDQTIAGIHADMDLMSTGDFGWRAVAAAISDIAAMGAEPVAVLIGLAIPDGFTDAELIELARSANQAATDSGAGIAGGDISSSPVLAANVTAIGRSLKDVEPVGRTGARVGDLVGVTGVLGGSAAGLALLRSDPADPDGARYRRPRARVTDGIALARAGASSMIDLSDGIATDAAHIGRASGVRLEIDPETLPIDPIAERASASLGLDPIGLAAGGGEDFELLFTIPDGASDEAASALNGDITWIGRVSDGEPGTSLGDLGLSGWEHGGTD